MDELRGKCGKGKDLGRREGERAGEREKIFKRTDCGHPTPSHSFWGQGASHPPAPGLGSLSQVSGIDAQEEEAIPRDGEGLGGLCFSRVLTLGWEGNENPACPSQEEQLPPRPVPPRTGSSWPVGAALRHGAKALSQGLLCLACVDRLSS